MPTTSRPHGPPELLDPPDDEAGGDDADGVDDPQLLGQLTVVVGTGARSSSHFA